MSVHNLYSITCFIYYSWKPSPEYLSIGFFCIFVPQKIKYIYLGHISCLNYSVFPVTKTPQTVFTGQYFPGSTAPQISFLPQSVTWVINYSFVISATDTGQFTSPSLQLLLRTPPEELHFHPFFFPQRSNFLSTWLFALLALREATSFLKSVTCCKTQLSCPTKHLSKWRRQIAPCFLQLMCLFHILNMVLAHFSTLTFFSDVHLLSMTSY